MDTNVVATKVCGTCRLKQAYEQFYFHEGKPYGRCKTCNKKYSNASRNRARELYRIKRGQDEEAFKSKYENYLEQKRLQQASIHEKSCSKCSQTKLLTEFYLSRGVRGSQCKSCQGENMRSWRERNAERARVYGEIHREKHHEALSLQLKEKSVRQRTKARGMTPDKYHQMCADQDNKCGICGNEESVMYHGRTKALAIDHCHTHGHTRGLLCSLCNTALERMENIPDWGAKALAYLQKHAPKE